MSEFLVQRSCCPSGAQNTPDAAEYGKGEILTVEATDPASVIDFTHFCNTTENEMVEHTEADGVFTCDPARRLIDCSFGHPANLYKQQIWKEVAPWPYRSHHQNIGVEVTGVDFSQPLPAADLAEIKQALLDHLVMVGRDQSADPKQLWRRASLRRNDGTASHRYLNG